MKQALAYAFQLAVIALLVGSACYKTVRSNPLEEQGTVVQTVLRPYHMHSYTVPVTHRSLDGKSTWTTYETRTDTYWEEHWVVFSCQHGQFAVNREDIWKKVNPGMRVIIRYRQVDKYKEKKGQPDIHVGTDFEFEDCRPADAEWGSK